MNVVVFVNGLPRAGKDTAVDFMCEHAEKAGWNTGAVSSIDCIRDALSMIGVDYSQKTDADRDLMSEMGRSLEKHSGFRTNRTVWAINEKTQDDKPNMIFVHVRESEVLRSIAKNLPDWYRTSVYISSPRALVPAETANASDREAMIMPLNCAFGIHNDSDLEALDKSCRSVVDDLLHILSTKAE